MLLWFLLYLRITRRSLSLWCRARGWVVVKRRCRYRNRVSRSLIVQANLYRMVAARTAAGLIA